MSRCKTAYACEREEPSPIGSRVVLLSLLTSMSLSRFILAVAILKYGARNMGCFIEFSVINILWGD